MKVNTVTQVAPKCLNSSLNAIERRSGQPRTFPTLGNSTVMAIQGNKSLWQQVTESDRMITY